MDRLEALGNQLSQVTLYDLKAYYNQAKNMVLNVSEMEAKVREATNDEPWGASSTLMQEIAQGTFNFQQFNEIMPCIYARFMEKEAKQWREIYKALQLLEYIIKHGSERVVDDARSHLPTIKMLRNFRYIDDKGNDQGFNVRRRASEITSLLSDLDKIRAERRKAKGNRNKYIGTGSEDHGMGGRYGGFGGDSLYGSGSGSGGGYGGNSDYYNGGGSSSFRDDPGRKGYEEYDAGDDEDAPKSRRSDTLRSPTSPSTSGPLTSGASGQSSKKDKEKEKKPAVVDDLLGDWGDDAATATAIQQKALPALASTGTDVDDFADFQSAPVSPPPTTAPLAFSQTPLQFQQSSSAPLQVKPKPNVFDILNQSQQGQAQAPAPPVLSRGSTQQSLPLGWQQTPPLQAQPVRPNYFGSGSSTGIGNTNANVPLSPTRAASFTGGSGSGTPFTTQTVRPAVGITSATSISGTATGKSSSSAATFDDLWSLGLGANNLAGKSSSGSAGKSIKDLEREKAQAGIWGTTQGQPKTTTSSMSAFGAFGSSGGSSASPATSGRGGDDLLL